MQTQQRWILWASIVMGFVLAGPPVLFSAEEFDKEGLEFYEKKIRPLLKEQCYRCHSEKAEMLEGDLYVDSREGLLKGGKQGPAIEPGEPAKSLLIQAVKYEMDDLKMPPDRRLEDRQIADLEKWIKMRAPAPKPPKKKRELGGDRGTVRRRDGETARDQETNTSHSLSPSVPPSLILRPSFSVELHTRPQ
jgi:hypothetical protein